MMVRLAIWSFEHIHAWSYGSAVKEIERAEVIGVADPDPKRAEEAGRRFGYRVLPSLEAILNEKPDALIVTTNNRDHTSAVIEAARAGVNVLCEKPLAITLNEARAMIEAARNARVRLATAFPCRYIPAMEEARRAFQGGSIGEPLAAMGTNRGKCPFDWFVKPELSGGGAIMDHTVHVVDLLRWILSDEVTSVFAESGNFFHKLDVEDAGIITLTFSKGTFATIDASWSRPVKSFPFWGDVTLKLVGTRGTIEVDSFNEKCVFYNDGKGLSEWVHLGEDMDLRLLSDFILSTEEDKEFPISAEDGLRATEVALAAYRSAETGQPVSLPLEKG